MFPRGSLWKNGCLWNSKMKHLPTVRMTTLDFPSGCLSCPLAFLNSDESLTLTSLLPSPKPLNPGPQLAMCGGVCSSLEMP